MATVELVAFTADNDKSVEQTVDVGEAHTLIPRFDAGPGKVVVQAATSDAEVWATIATLSSRPSSNKLWQVNGPLSYRVCVRNAGCDLDTGA